MQMQRPVSETDPVLFFTRFVPTYRVPVLERLNKRLNNRLVVCSGLPSRDSSLKKLVDEQHYQYRQIKLENYWFRENTFHVQPFGAAFKQFEAVAAVIAEESPRLLSVPFLLRHARKSGAGRVLWGHFSSNNRPFSPRHPLDRYRIALARRVDACVCYTDGVRDLLAPYVPPENLFVARNTLDTDTLFALYDLLEKEGKTSVRQRLGLPEEGAVLVYIGRLIPEKGTDLLLDTFAALRNNRPASLLVIGDGPERSRMEERAATIPDVHFLGALTAWADSGPYLYASDLMLMPGYLGLSVNHAFAFGVPVVSRQAPEGIRYHSPEVEYVRHGENGLLCAWDDPAGLLRGVEQVLAKQEQFSHRARTYARQELTIDRMVDGLEAAVQKALAASKNRAH